MSSYQERIAKRQGRQWLMAVFFLLVLVGGWVFPLLGYFIPLCMVLGIGISLFWGRKWCDWYCPRGSFYDTAAKAISLRRSIPAFVRTQKFKIISLSILMLMMVSNIISRWPDPVAIGGFFVMMLTSTTIIGIILAMLYHQRSWCCFCPIGSMSGWIGRSRKPLMIESRLCTECRMCANVCPMNIAPYAYKGADRQRVASDDCIRCNLCVCACPTKALSRNG